MCLINFLFLIIDYFNKNKFIQYKNVNSQYKYTKKPDRYKNINSSSILI